MQNSATTPTAAPAPVNDQQSAATEAATAEAATGDVQVGNGIYKNVARTMKEAVEVLKTLSAVDIVTRATGRSAQINSEQRNKLVSDRARRKSNANGFPDADHFMAVVNIKEFFENSQLLDSVQDRNNDQNIKSIKHFSAPMTINGKKADVYMTIKESVSNGHRICSLELTEIRKPSDAQGGKLKSNELYHTSDGSEVNIAPSSKKSSQNTAAPVKLGSVAEITDEDFISPVRDIELPPLPEKRLS